MGESGPCEAEISRFWLKTAGLLEIEKVEKLQSLKLEKLSNYTFKLYASQEVDT